MELIKLTYSIHYTHILTFHEQYRSKIAPFFKLEDLRYGFNNPQTFEESIRLVFDKHGFAVVCQKDSVVLVYEGELKEAKRSSSFMMDTYFDIFNAIKAIEGFGRITFHQLQTFSIDKSEKPIIELESIDKSKIVKKHPFSNVKDFAVNYETKDDSGMEMMITLGNFRANDIQKFELSPFTTKYNKDLGEYVGYLCNLTVKEITDSVSYSKFKSLITEMESKLSVIESWIK